MRHYDTALLTALLTLGCSPAGGSPPPLSTGSDSLSGGSGDGTATTAGPAGEGEGEGEAGSTTTGGEAEVGPGSNPTTTMSSGDDTTTGETASDTSTSTGSPPDLPPSTSTGEVCEEWARYQCQGWAAGLYCREDNCALGSGHQFTVNSVQAVVCIDDIFIELPFAGMTDSNLLYDACRAQCEAQVWEWDEVHPGSSSVDYIYQDLTVCVFEDDGNEGYVPPAQWPAGQASNIGVADCPWTNQSPPVEPQVIYIGPCEEECNPDCEQEIDCEQWELDVDTQITSSFTVRTNTYTTKVDEKFWDEFVHGTSTTDPRFREYYACDLGRYQQIFNGGLESFRVENTVAGEMLYEMGFRHGDQLVKIAWAGTPGAWTYLDSYEDMGAFFDLHGDKTSFKVEWLRGLTVYKMNLSFM